MATLNPLDALAQSAWLTAVFGGARYMRADLQDFPKKTFTLSFWCRTSQEGTVLFLGDSEDGNSTDSQLTSMSIRISGMSVEVRFANWAEWHSNPSINLSDGADHYIALTFAQPGDAKTPDNVSLTLYVDGLRQESFNATLKNSQDGPISVVGGPLYIATRPPEDHNHGATISVNDGFPGRITDLRVWSRVLSADEIAEDQWNIVFGDEPDLYLAIPLDEDSVNRAAETVLDLTPNHRHAETEIIQDDMQLLYYADSVSAFPVDSRTAEMWVRCGSSTGGNILISYAEVSSSDHPNDGGVPWFLTLNDLGSGQVNVIDGEWHHIAVVVNETTNTDTFYIDGVPQSSRSSTLGQITDQPFLLGARQATDANDQLFAGLIKDFYLWSGVRTDDQIWDSANGQRPVADATLVLNALQSQDDSQGNDSDTADTGLDFSPKHFLTLSGEQMAIGSAILNDPANPLEFNDYTVVIMVRPSKPGALFSRMKQADWLHGFSIACVEGGGVRVSEYDGQRFRITSYDPGQFGVNLLDGYRHSVAFRCVDDGCALFIDGVSVGVTQRSSADNPTYIDVSSLGVVQIGGADLAAPESESAQRFEGDLFMMAYWGLGLADSDIHKAAFELMDGLYTGMLGYWSFNRSLNDQSYVGDDLTMSSAGWFYPALRTIWAQSSSSLYRFHHLEGVAHRKREGERDVDIIHIIDVPAGAAMFYGGLTGRGHQFVPPAGVVVSLTDPNGSQYAAESDNDTVFVKLRGAGILAFVIKQPIAGKWKVEIKAKAQDDFIFQAQVLPEQGAAEAIHATLKPLFGPNDLTDQQRARLSPTGVLAIIATTALAAVVGAVAVAAGVVTSPISFPLMLLFGVANAAATLLIVALDRKDRVIACGQTASATLPPRAGNTPLPGSNLQIIDTLTFPKPTGGATRSVLTFNIPAGTTAFSFHVWFDPSKVSSASEDKGLVLIPPNGGKVPDDNEPFLYLSNLAMERTGLTPGYCAVSVPINPTQANNLIGQWTARIQNLAGVDPAIFDVRLCIRTVPANAPAAVSYRVPVNLFYLGSRWFKRTYKDLFKDIPAFLNNSIYSQANIHLDCAPLQHLRENPKSISADLYNAATKALVQKYSTANAINVYIVEEMNIPIMGEGNPGGFSAIMGPQGFMSPYNCIFAMVGDSDKYEGLRDMVAIRIAHEIGHSLGLVHTSSCLDNQGIATNSDTAAALSQCKIALTERGTPKSPLKSSIDGNLMYTHNPGPKLNPKQVFLIQHAPLLTPLIVTQTELR